MPQCVGLSCRFSGRATIRGELALKRKHIIAAKARENQACGQGGVLLLENSPKAFDPIDTRAEIAKIAGVSHDTIARGELALKRKHIIAAKAKKNQKRSGGAVPQKSAEPVETRKELAKIAGVSHDTIARVHESGRCTLPFRGGNIEGRPAGGGPGFF